MQTTQTCPAADRDYVAITGYREADEVLRRSREFVVEGAKPESINFLGGTIVTLDGAEHLARRRMFAKMIDIDQPWGPRGTLLAETFARNLDELKADLPEDGRFDLVAFTRRVLWQTLAQMIGLDGVSDAEGVKELQSLVPAIIAGVSVEYATRDHELVVQEALAAMAEFRGGVFGRSYRTRLDLVRAARASGSEDDLSGDLITRMIAAADGEPDENAILREAIIFFAGSVNNPVAQTANALEELERWLDSHPEDLGRVGDVDFLNDVVLETLRLRRTGNQYLIRRAVSDVTLNSTGRRLPAGTWVAVYIGVANLDKQVFGPDADTFDPHRVVEAQGVKRYGLAFGSGPHVCLGRPLMTWEHGDPPLLGIQSRTLKCLVDAGVRVDPSGVRRKDEHTSDRWAEFGVRLGTPLTGLAVTNHTNGR